MAEDQNADYEIQSLERRAGDLQEGGLLTTIRDEIEDIDTQLSQLPTQLQEVRTRGYVFKSHLEEQINSMQQQWESIRERVEQETDRRVHDLRADLRRAEQAVRGLSAYKGRSLNAAKDALERVEGDLDSVERRVDAAIRSVRGMYDSIQSSLGEVGREVQECSETLDLMDSASFGFRPGESGVATSEGKWLRDGQKEGPKGILFLTDQRILFEQREKVAKKKLLFITTASEQVQELQWEAPIGAVEEADASEQRRALVIKKEHLNLTFSSPATVRQVIVELREDSEAWRSLINLVANGEIDRERVEGAKEKAQEAAASIDLPERCPSCGAALDATVIRGMTAIKCEFCGTSISVTNS